MTLLSFIRVVEVDHQGLCHLLYILYTEEEKEEEEGLVLVFLEWQICNGRQEHLVLLSGNKL